MIYRVTEEVMFSIVAINNPGKFERYSNVTGLMSLLSNFWRMMVNGRFLNNIYPLVEKHVKRYIDRGLPI